LSKEDQEKIEKILYGAGVDDSIAHWVWQCDYLQRWIKQPL